MGGTAAHLASIGFLAALLAGPRTAAAATPAEEAWLDALYDEVASDLIAGRPLVVQAHVPLCDNDIIPCGNAKLGDGDNPATNLYWATSGGFVGWFGRKGSGWKQVARVSGAKGSELLEVRVWKRRFAAGAVWRHRGVKKRFDVYVVAYAWRGEAIDTALAEFVADAFGDSTRRVDVQTGLTLRAGGAARVVAYVGHNRWMDIPDYDWAAAAKRHPGKQRRGVIAIACHTQAYLGDELPSEQRVPLLMTRDFLFAGAHSFEGAVSAFARGESLAGIRAGAAKAYARGQDKPYRRVRGVFTNPSDRRWKKGSGH